MMITLKNFVFLLRSLLLTYCAFSYAMEDNSPAGQLGPKSIERPFLELPLEVFYSMAEFLNEADILHLMQTNTSSFEKLRAILFTKIRLAACKGCCEVPPCNIDYYEMPEICFPMALIFGVVPQSDVNLLNRALRLPAGNYLEAENCADKKYSLAIATPNNFMQGVARLQNEFESNITPEDCQELAGNRKFHLTENLLLAAIHLISHLDLEKLLNGQDVSFDPSLNDDAILKALVHAVHHGKMDHAKVLFNSQYSVAYFLPENYYRLRPYIDYSCKNFDDASFVEFLIEKQPKNTLLLVDMFGDCLKTYRRTYALFKLYAIAPEYFQTSLPGYYSAYSYFFWQVEPKELFIMLQDCNLDILPWISYASWNQFSSIPYNDDAVKCLLRKYYCPDENVALSAHPYWKKVGTKFYAHRNSLSQDLSLENEAFLLVFIKSLGNQYHRFEKFIAFLNNKHILSKSMRDSILAHFRGLQNQSYLRYLRRIDFASS